MGLRFGEDRMLPCERFTMLKQRLGDAVRGDLDRLETGPHGFIRTAHLVLDRLDPPSRW